MPIQKRISVAQPTLYLVLEFEPDKASPLLANCSNEHQGRSFTHSYRVNVIFD